MSDTRNAYMTGIAPEKPRKLLSGRGILTGRFVDNVFQPSLIFHLLKPRGRTGNQINGLDEPEFRRAKKIYHWLFSDSRNYPFLWVNWIFVLRSKFNKESKKFGFGDIFKQNLELMRETNELNRERLPEGTTPVERSTEEWGEVIKQKAREFGAGDVGITRVSEEMLFENKPAPGKYVILIAMPMQYERASKLPSAEGSCETMQVYLDSNKVGLKLARWLRTQGVEAKGSHLLPEKFLLVPAAIKAGLGQLGKHGSMIHPKFGSLVRLNYVAVDIELPVDEPIDFGVDEFCAHCQVCTQNCPPQAILPEKQMVRGTRKWYVDFDKCVPYFNDVHGCGRCLAVCPWSQPGVADDFLVKLARQKDKLAELATQL